MKQHFLHAYFVCIICLISNHSKSIHNFLSSCAKHVFFTLLLSYLGFIDPNCEILREKMGSLRKRQIIKPRHGRWDQCQIIRYFKWIFLDAPKTVSFKLTVIYIWLEMKKPQDRFQTKEFVYAFFPMQI